MKIDDFKADDQDMLEEKTKQNEKAVKVVTSGNAVDVSELMKVEDSQRYKEVDDVEGDTIGTQLVAKVPGESPTVDEDILLIATRNCYSLKLCDCAVHEVYTVERSILHMEFHIEMSFQKDCFLYRNCKKV
jgi:hypothetical protein